MDNLFTSGVASDEYAKKVQNRSAEIAASCLANLNTTGECFVDLPLYERAQAKAAATLLATKGWDTFIDERPINYATRGGPQIVLRAQTPARVREKMQLARAALDSILNADVAHWRRRWRLADWLSDQTHNWYFACGLDADQLEAARKSFKARDYDKAGSLFEAAFTARESTLSALEVNGSETK